MIWLQRYWLTLVRGNFFVSVRQFQMPRCFCLCHGAQMWGTGASNDPHHPKYVKDGNDIRDRQRTNPKHNCIYPQVSCVGRMPDGDQVLSAPPWTHFCDHDRWPNSCDIHTQCHVMLHFICFCYSPTTENRLLATD